MPLLRCHFDLCVDPTNDIQLVIKHSKGPGLRGVRFSHRLIFARQIFPFETFTTHFYLLAAQGTSVWVILASLLYGHTGAPIGPFCLHAPIYDEEPYLFTF